MSDKKEQSHPPGQCDGIQKVVNEVEELKKIAQAPLRECGGIKETIKEVRKLSGVVDSLAQTAIVNKTNLENITNSYQSLATDNSMTHHKLFDRTSTLKVSIAKVETSFTEHEKHGSEDTKNQQHRSVYLLSMVAIVVSVVTAIVLAVLPGLFH